MAHQNLFLKTIGFQKTAFANTLAIISTMQQHGESLLKTTLEQSLWLPESSRKACLYWADVYAKNFENMKVLVDQGFTEMERISSTSLKPDKLKPQKTATAGRHSASRPPEKTPADRKKPASVKKSAVVKTAPVDKAVFQETPAEAKAPPQKDSTVRQSAAIITDVSQPEPTLQPIVTPVSEDK